MKDQRVCRSLFPIFYIGLFAYDKIIALDSAKLNNLSAMFIKANNVIFLMKFLSITLLPILFIFMVLQFSVFQMVCADKNEYSVGNYEIIGGDIVKSNGVIFFISQPYKIQSTPNTEIMFHHVRFTLPYNPIPSPPGGIRSTMISFQDGVTETLSKGVTSEISTVFSTHSKPSAGLSRDPDNNFYFLISIDSEPPLLQFKYGIQIDQIQCKDGLTIVTKSFDGSPACVKPQTKQILIERGWAKPI